MGVSASKLTTRYTLAEHSSAQAISSSVMDLQGDEQLTQRSQRASQLRWDRKTKKFKKDPQQDGSAGPMIKTESGALLPATFDSGRFKEWNRKRGAEVNVRIYVISADSQRGGGHSSQDRANASEILNAKELRQNRVLKTKVCVCDRLRSPFSEKKRTLEHLASGIERGWHQLACSPAADDVSNRFRDPIMQRMP